MLLSSFFVFGQKQDKLFYTFHLQPEKTYYYDSYDLLNRDPKPVSTFNAGMGVGVHYELSNKLFLETGLDYISRKLITKVIFDQHSLPPNRRWYTDELIITKSIELRMLYIPLNFGCRITINEKLNLYLNAGVTGNLLLNTDYFSGYRPAFWKLDLNGYTLNLGIGSYYKISKNCIINGMITYSVINSVKEDRYLDGDSHHDIALTHEFLKLTLGVNVSYKVIDTLLLKRKY